MDHKKLYFDALLAELPYLNRHTLETVYDACALSGIGLHETLALVTASVVSQALAEQN